MNEEQLISVFRAANPQQAAIVCTLLNNAGVEAILDGDGLQGGAGELPVGWATAPRVRVWKKDEDAAREVIKNFESGAYEEAVGWNEVDFVDGGFDWPACPACDELRQVQCPHCEFVGIDFESESLFNVELGSAEPEHSDVENSGPGMDTGVGFSDSGHSGSTGEAHVLKCPICSKKSPPAFINVCRHCSHQFDDGTEFHVSESRQGDSNVSISWPIVLVGVLLFGLAALGAYYFATL